MKRIAVLLSVFALGLAIPTLATAQLGPGNVPAPLTAPSPSQQPAAPANDPDSGLSSTQILLMIGGAIAIITVIAWVIVRDARSAAPVLRGKSSGDGGGSGSSAPNKSTREREREQARKRAKAKAARNQRKRNRPH